MVSFGSYFSCLLNDSLFPAVIGYSCPVLAAPHDFSNLPKGKVSHQTEVHNHISFFRVSYKSLPWNPYTHFLLIRVWGKKTQSEPKI